MKHRGLPVQTHTLIKIISSIYRGPTLYTYSVYCIQRICVKCQLTYQGAATNTVDPETHTYNYKI
jgi:hypothetical protein